MVVFLIEGATFLCYSVWPNAISTLELGEGVGATYQLHRLWIELYTEQLVVLMAAKTAAKPVTGSGYIGIGQDLRGRKSAYSRCRETIWGATPIFCKPQVVGSSPTVGSL